MTTNRITPQFTPDCTKWETVFGLFWLIMHVLALPLIAAALQLFVFPDMDDITVNALYYGLSLAVVLIFFMKLLRREFDHLLDRLLRCLKAFLLAYFFWYNMSFIMAALLTLFDITAELPNDAAVDAMAHQNYNITLVISVIAAPILEEVLFRGILFQSIRKKSRVWAYVASLALFGLYHVWQYALLYQDPMYLLFALQYIPITFALTWSYEYSGSLWTPIFFHATNNLLAMQVMQMM